MPRRRPVTDTYLHDGVEYKRAGREDFDTLPERVVQVVERVPGSEGNQS